MEHMKPLLGIEKELLNAAKKYIKHQKRQISELLPFAESVQEAIDLSSDDESTYLGHPLNCYLIIKRFTSGWTDLPSRMNIDEESLKNIEQKMAENEKHMPSLFDLSGATGALLRFMDNFGTTTKEISDGEIDGVKPSLFQLTAKDALDIADVAHSSRRYVRMKDWLLEAERLINDPSIPHRHGNTTRLAVNIYLAWAYYLENDLETALKYTELILKDDPENKAFQQNKIYYSYHVKYNVPITFPQTRYMEMAKHVLKYGMDMDYIRHCKEKQVPVKKYKHLWNLRSFYKQDNPRFYLKPVKVTQIHDNPVILLFHDILSEEQINKLITIATPRIQTATVVDRENDTATAVTYRVSKSMFLNSNFVGDKKITDELNPIFKDLTGLNQEPGEELQMNNYGLGGQYEGHHDYGEPGTKIALDESGNRMSTLLIYLSNVEKGGETVFTRLGLTVPPLKGSGLFWHNLHRNGTGWFNTRHASCPMVSGSKWVANKWIHERGNEFTRPCSLNQWE